MGTSASRLKNNRWPQLERALKDMGTKCRTLIVWAVDRQSRKGLTEDVEVRSSTPHGGGGGSATATIAVHRVRVTGSRMMGATKANAADGNSTAGHFGSGRERRSSPTAVSRQMNPLITEFTPTAPIQNPSERVKRKWHVGQVERIFNQ